MFMIIFSRLNGDTARLGNQLFRIASTIGIASKYNHKYGFPEWKYSTYFVNPLPSYDHTLNFTTVNEKKYEFHNWELKDGNYDLYGWLQTEKYFDTNKVKSQFTFKPEIVKKAIEPYKKILDKKNILITIRRGDFINHHYYHQLSFNYYFLALIKNFPDWKERNIIFTSDDMDYCKRHFSFLKNAYFIEDTDPMIHFIVGTKCDDFIISNSTFSWWTAWLGERDNTKVIRPIKNFRGLESQRKNDKDFFPERWIKFDQSQYRIPSKYWSNALKGIITDLKLDTFHFYKKVKQYLKHQLSK